MGFGKDGKGAILYDSVNNIDIGALAGNDAILVANRYDSGVMLEDFRIIKVDYWIGIRPSQTTTLYGGPIIVGLAHGDLTAAEIEEVLESTVLSAGDIVASDVALRPVWPLEMILMPDADLGNSSDLVRKDSVNIRWTFNDPEGWVWFVYNAGTVALVAGNGITILAKIFGMWVT